MAIINAQREASVATIVAQKEANVSLINLEMTIKEKQAQQKRQAIDDQIYVANQKGKPPPLPIPLLSNTASLRCRFLPCSAVAEAAHHRITLEAEANALRLTPEYLRMVLYQSLANNTKVRPPFPFSPAVRNPEDGLKPTLVFFLQRRSTSARRYRRCSWTGRLATRTCSCPSSSKHPRRFRSEPRR